MSRAKIDPDEDYPIAEAAKLVPSCKRRCKHINVATLYRWVRQGKVAVKHIGQGAFITGAELLRIRAGDAPPSPPSGRSPLDRKVAQAMAERKAMAMGLPLPES